MTTSVMLNEDSAAIEQFGRAIVGAGVIARIEIAPASGIDATAIDKTLDILNICTPPLWLRIRVKSFSEELSEKSGGVLERRQ